MKTKNICSLFLIILIACSGPIRKSEDSKSSVLDAYTLRMMHKDHRYTHFYYNDGTLQEGLLLQWDIDSIKVKTYGEEQPKYIPSDNLEKIEIVVGNKMLKYLAIAGPLGFGAYIAVDPPPAFGGDNEPSFAVLLAPMAIVTAMIYGVSKEKRAIFTIPPDFKFDYEKENRYFDLLE